MQRPIQHVGIGLRSSHYQYILENLPRLPWFEVLAENYFYQNNFDFHCLEQIRQHYPLFLHCVGMSLGSTDPLNLDYLAKLKELIAIVQPLYISDHLCWISVDGKYLHDLLPLPFTEETVCHVVERIKRVQDYLGRPILVENVSSYFQYPQNTMTEAEFLGEIALKADCNILLDVNNLFINSKNHGFDTGKYLNILPKNRIKQLHLAGHEDKGEYFFDAHSSPIETNVWQLYHAVIKKFGVIPTIIERDENIPEFAELEQEALCAQQIIDEVGHVVA